MKPLHPLAASVTAFAMLAASPHDRALRGAQSASPGPAAVERTHPYRVHPPAASPASAPAPAAEPPAAAPASADMLAEPPASAGSGVAVTPAPAPSAASMSAPARVITVAPNGAGGVAAARPFVPAGDSRVHVLVSTVGVTGGLPAEIPRRVMLMRSPVIGNCYRRGLAFNPSLQGMMILRVSINPNGTVSDVTTAVNYVQDPAVTACVVNVMRTAVYPAAARPVPTTATYRIQLRQSP